MSKKLNETIDNEARAIRVKNKDIGVTESLEELKSKMFLLEYFKKFEGLIDTRVCNSISIKINKMIEEQAEIERYLNKEPIKPEQTIPEYKKEHEEAENKKTERILENHSRNWF